MLKTRVWTLHAIPVSYVIQMAWKNLIKNLQNQQRLKLKTVTECKWIVYLSTFFKFSIYWDIWSKKDHETSPAFYWTWQVTGDIAAKHLIDNQTEEYIKAEEYGKSEANSSNSPRFVNLSMGGKNLDKFLQQKIPEKIWNPSTESGGYPINMLTRAADRNAFL